MATTVDDYIADASAWSDEMAAVRRVMLDCGLDEAIKWNKPCFVDGDSNIAILQPMRDVLGLMFFRGALLDDPDGVLVEQGPNSRSAKRVEFTSTGDVEGRSAALRALVDEARRVADEGIEVEPAPEPNLADELQERLDADPRLRTAWEGLTPGRRREYNLHISSAKRTETRTARVEKQVARILAGKGLRDR